MNNAERLKAEREIDTLSKTCGLAVVERDALRTENEALRRDAERYRWLRNDVIQDGEINEEIHVAVESPSWPNCWALTGDDLDQAIDAMRQEK